MAKQVACKMLAAQPSLRTESRQFAARCEPFDTYWQGSRNLARDYESFRKYYKANYLPRLPQDRSCAILVMSCGPGYLVNALVQAGYHNVHGIDSDPGKIEHARARNLPCAVASAFAYLEDHPESFDVLIPEQEFGLGSTSRPLGMNFGLAGFHVGVMGFMQYDVGFTLDSLLQGVLRNADSVRPATTYTVLGTVSCKPGSRRRSGTPAA